MKHELTSMRLQKAMRNVDISQRELSQKAHINEASVSQYINGSHAPSNVSAGKMAEVLNVNPVWLMGFDVPMDIEHTYSSTNPKMVASLMTDMKLKDYVERYMSLSNASRKLIDDSIDLLLKMEKDVRQ